MRRWVLIFDIVMLVLFVIVFIPSLTGVATHEWLGLIVLVVFIVHMALNVDQVWGTIKRLFRRSSSTGGSAGEIDQASDQGAGDADAEIAAPADSPEAPPAVGDADLAAAANTASTTSSSGSAGSGMGMRVLRLILNIALLVDLVVCIVSGLLISGAVLPTFGLYVPEGYYFWNPLHSTSAMILLALILVHIVIHFRWIIGNFRRKKREK